MWRNNSLSGLAPFWHPEQFDEAFERVSLPQLAGNAEKPSAAEILLQSQALPQAQHFLEATPLCVSISTAMSAAYLIDMDGVIYRENKLTAGADEMVRAP